MCWLNQPERKALDATDPRPARDREKRDGKAIETNIWLRNEDKKRGEDEVKRRRHEQMWREIKSPTERYKEETDEKCWRIGGREEEIDKWNEIMRRETWVSLHPDNLEESTHRSTSCSPRFISAAETQLGMQFFLLPRKHTPGQLFWPQMEKYISLSLSSLNGKAKTNMSASYKQLPAQQFHNKRSLANWRPHITRWGQQRTEAVCVRECIIQCQKSHYKCTLKAGSVETEVAGSVLG